MDTNDTPARLRLVTTEAGNPDEEEASHIADRRREDYWSQVQALGADLASLRHAN
jgi:hypothetical protein